MGLRVTKKAGLLKVRHQDQKIQKVFDSVIERIEVLDGIKGDPLDRAVTYRDLQVSGFDVTVSPGSSGAPLITNTPGPGDGSPVPTVGFAAPPTGFSAA